MAQSFVSSDKVLFTSESVTEGHPDKLCDQVSDAVLDECLRQDPNSRVACETATTTGVILVAGEITTHAYVDVPRLVRSVVQDIGYTNADYGFDYRTCGVLTAIKEQSPEIAQGVDESIEAREGIDAMELGAGDQGMMFGFAVRETPELMPLPITLSHAVARQLAKTRKDGTLPYLRPDGKTQVTVEYEKGMPKRVHTVVVAAQHDPGIDYQRLCSEIREQVIRPAIVGPWLDSNTKYLVNGTGAFTIDGPMGDAGLTGRKIIVDTYGGYARHGGGAFSGKDATKVDRSAAYVARYVAKNIVAAGLADRCEVQLAYAIGVAKPVSILVDTFGRGKVDPAFLSELVRSHFSLTPKGIIESLKLRRPIFKKTAAYGHFGRSDPDFTWEATDKAAKLASDAGVREPVAVRR